MIFSDAHSHSVKRIALIAVDGLEKCPDDDDDDNNDDEEEEDYRKAESGSLRAGSCRGSTRT